MLRRAADIDAAQQREPKAKAVIMATVAKLLLGLGSQSLDRDGERIRASAYQDALDDLPGWAVAEAGRRWLRDPTKEWAPKPPQLRAATIEVLTIARGVAASLRVIATAQIAEVREPTTDESRADMLARMEGLMAELRQSSPAAARAEAAE